MAMTVKTQSLDKSTYDPENGDTSDGAPSAAPPGALLSAGEASSLASYLPQKYVISFHPNLFLTYFV